MKVDSSVDSSVLEIRFLDATKSEELQITKQCIADFNHGFPGKALACPLVVGKRIDGEGPVHAAMAPTANTNFGASVNENNGHIS